MSIASLAHNQKSFEGSSEAQDMQQQFKILIDENSFLKESLEELIEHMTDLTESIEEYNRFHAQNYKAVGQTELDQLLDQVKELEQQLTSERQKNKEYERVISIQGFRDSVEYQQGQGQQYMNMNAHPKKSDEQFSEHLGHPEIEQILNVVSELAQNFDLMQTEYSSELSELREQFSSHQSQYEEMLMSMEKKLQGLSENQNELLTELRSKDEVIANLRKDMAVQRNKKSQIQKQMKISLTIEDLKNTLEGKIQQKEKTIKKYERLIQEVRDKFNQLF